MDFLLIGSVIVALFVGWLVGRAHGIRVTDDLSTLLLVALLFARLAFVFQYWDEYRISIWSVIDIRDGGFSWPGAFIAAGAYFIWLIYKKPAARSALFSAVIAGVLSWSATGGAFLLLKPHAEGLPQALLAGLDGDTVSLDDVAENHHGPIVVNFWASWCPPCRAEMPMLQRAQRNYPDTLFIFVNSGESVATVKRFLTSEQLILDHVLLDENQQLGQLALPTTLFYDPQGQFVGQHRGMLSAATLAHSLTPLIRQLESP